MTSSIKTGLKFLGLFAATAIFVSCAMTPRKRPPELAKPDAKQEYEQIRQEVESGKKKKAKIRLSRLAKANPGTDIADDAYILLGELHYDNAEYAKSYEAFISVVHAEVFSPREGDAYYGAAKSLDKLGRFDEALSLTARGLKFDNLPDKTRLGLYRIRVRLLSQMGDRLDALEAMVYLAEKDPKQRNREKYQAKAIDFVESQLDEKDLSKVAGDSDYGFVRGHAAYRVGMLNFEQGEFRRARSYLEDVVDYLPETDLAERAQRYIDQINARRRVQPQTIGAILPLTGRHAKVAQRTLKGLQLGLGVFGKNRSNFRLAVIDSEGNPDTARRAVEKLVTEDHVIAIVGSLLSRTSVAVASKANELGVPNIALSQKTGLTEVGNHVFRNALTSEMQVRHLVQRLVVNNNMTRFAILYPNDRYGIEYANLFWDEVLAKGGKIVAAQSYDPKETDFRGPIQRMVGTYYLEDRKHEYKLLLEDWMKKQKSISSRVSPPDELLPPVVDFEAIFIPDSTKALGQIAPMLAYHDIQNVSLVGTNLWNSRSLIRRGQKYVEGSLFVDATGTNSTNFKDSQFFRDFNAVYGKNPGVFEAQAYDAGLILRQIIASGESSRVGLRGSLKSVKNFSGALGSLNMTPERELRRPMITLTVTDGVITPIN